MRNWAFWAAFAFLSTSLAAPAHAASVITSPTPPTTDVLLSQPDSGGSAQVDSEQDPTPANDTIGQSFTPTANWQLDAITLRNSNSNLWGADDSILIVVIDNVSTWLTQSWGRYSDVLAMPSSFGGVNLLAREEFTLAPLIQPQLATFELSTPLNLSAGTQYGFLVYLDTDDGFTWLATTAPSFSEPLPGENLLFTPSGPGGNSSVTFDMLFYLQGTEAPEPGAALLVGLGIAGLLGRARSAFHSR